MVTIAVCERMRWDYFTYQEQPTWFIEGLLRKWEIDHRNQEQAAKQAKRGA